MNSTVLALIILVVGLAAGLALGWFLGSRPVAEWRARHAERDGEARDVGERLARMVPELATMSERAARGDTLASHLDIARGERETLRAENAGLRADAANFADRERLLIEARELLLKEFQNAGAKVLGEAQESFLKRAQDRFAESEGKNEARIRALLAPVGDRLKSYEDQVASLEAKRVDSFGQLTGLIEGMRAGQEAIRAEAQRLGNSLRNAPKARGRWGEQQLRNVLEQCGLAEHTDFVTEHSVDSEEGRLRPDAIVRIPGNKLLVIDAKVSLNDYQDSTEATDDLTRDACLDRHVASMKNHIQTLAAKSYQSQFDEAPDYVIMFVPGEHFIAAAIERDARGRANSLDEDAQRRIPDLWNFAFDRRVLLASPTNLVAIARTIAQVWRQDGLAKEAREIGRMGGELYDRLAKITEDLGKVGTNLGKAVGSFNDFSRSLNSRVLVSAKRLKEKHIEIGKRDIEDVPLVEVAPLFNDTQEVVQPGEALLIGEAAGDT